MDDDNDSTVELGFVKKVPTWELHHRYFPNKVGGCSAWLDLKNLPFPDDLQCASCKEPLSFLLQIYAPDSEDPQGFHRTIYVFVCRKSECMKPGASPAVRVFRCCLARRNDFYDYEPPVKDDKLTDPAVSQPLCAICGCLAPNTCSSCKKSFYCSRAHQMSAWKSGHKEECAKLKTDESIKHGSFIKTPTVFSEYDIIIEPEELDDEQDERTEDERLLEYKKTLMDMKPELNDVSVDELDSFCANAKDKAFIRFRKRVNQNPEQILRYDKGGQPLFISSKNVPGQKDVPKCTCGGKRRFEFQITPQLLNFLEQEETLEDGLDFGTILVYTCSKNCHGNLKYAREFGWVQLVEQGDSSNGSGANGMEIDSDSE